MTADLRHPLRIVTQKTGLTPDLVRAWERRYQVVTPTRSAGGQRLYSDADVERLRQLHRAVLSGHAISQVARLDAASLEQLVSEPAAKATDLPDRLAEETVATTLACLAALERLDAAGLESELRRAALHYTVPLLLDRVVAPLLTEIGRRWEAGTLQIIHEHLASVEVQRLLMWLIHSARVEGTAPVLAVTTPLGQLMELGALMVAASAADEGWRVIWLGPNMPAKDIVHGVETLAPRAVAISLVHQARDKTLPRELEHLARGVAGKAALLVGGRAVDGYALLLERHGAIVLRDLDMLRHWLRSQCAGPSLTRRSQARLAR